MVPAPAPAPGQVNAADFVTALERYGGLGVTKLSQEYLYKIKTEAAVNKTEIINSLAELAI